MKVRMGRLAVKMEENVSAKLKAVGMSIHSPEVVTELQRGAEIMAQGARTRAPIQSGLLRRGIYTISLYKLNMPGDKRILMPRYLPRTNQVLIVSGTFYSNWVEYGRKGRKGDHNAAKKKLHRSVGKVKRTPFFRSGITSMRGTAEAFIARRIQRLIEQAAK